MKHISPKIVLVIIAFLMAVLIAVLVFVFIDVTTLSQIQLGQIFFFISLAASFVLLLSVHELVFKKINQLFITVKHFRKQGDSGASSNAGGYEIDNLNQEILAWADDRKTEIDRLRKLEVYRKEFLGNVSHELKTPIFNIQGYVLTLLDGGLEDKTINRDYLVRAERSVDRMIAIVEDLEAISQLETGELKLELERFDIVALCKDILNAEEMKATSKGIMLSLEGDLKPMQVFADRFRIRQVLTNLIVNSIKYGKEYGETKVNFYDRENDVVVEITDNGIGIPTEFLPRLFERFFRVDKSRSRDQGGTGLGLAIAKHILEAHNQTIQVTSKEGIGTTFSFTLAKE